MLSIGQKLIKLREVVDKKQKEFAESIGILPQALIKYEKDKVKPSADLLIKIAETHKVNINWLLTDNGDMFLEQKPKELEKCDEVREAYMKLPADRQKYYYHKIIAESLEE
ncbi:MAG: helix-turn-helix transcriptional regulator [Campylobacterales bacterium]|nr:helix-turn-helix transcriptional regulator [Campylobacterales bacterium]